MATLDTITTFGPATAPPADLLAELLRAGKLPRLRRWFGVPMADGGGDCHRIATSLLLDIYEAGRAADWQIVFLSLLREDGRPPISHCWLECDGWVVNASHGRVTVAPLAEVHDLVRNAVRLTARQWVRMTDRDRERVGLDWKAATARLLAAPATNP